MLNIFELEKIVNGKIQNENCDISKVFTDVSIDSRNILDNSLFIAIKGSKFDGHDFISSLNPSCVALVERYIDCSITQVLVKDVKQSLQNLANYWRNQFDIPVVGVVGSNGKTSVKDMIASIFKESTNNEYTATVGNLNNDIGLPISILKMRQHHKLAVFEIGMNHPQETILLSKILQPTVAVINNAQREHQEFMQSIENVAIEHGYLLEDTNKLKHAILPFDSEFFSMWANQCLDHNIYITSFGLGNKANINASHAYYNGSYELNINHSNINYTQNINLLCLGVHNICNSLAAIAASIACGVEIHNIITGIEKFNGTKGRLQKQIINNKYIINDTYNANPDSVKAAIDVLRNLPSKRLLILGDMGEVGERGTYFHEEIGQYAKENHIDAIYTLGNLAKHSSLSFYIENIEKNCFFAIEDLYAFLALNIEQFSSILIKGSRFMQMERVVTYIENLYKNN